MVLAPGQTPYHMGLYGSPITLVLVVFISINQDRGSLVQFFLDWLTNRLIDIRVILSFSRFSLSRLFTLIRKAVRIRSIIQLDYYL